MVFRITELRLLLWCQISYRAVSSILSTHVCTIHFEDPLVCSNAVSDGKEWINKDQEEFCTAAGSDPGSSDKIGLSVYSLWNGHHKLVQRSWKTIKTGGNPLEVLIVQFPKLYNI